MSLSGAWPPEMALSAAAVGVLLLYVECNRPGRVVPGCVGLVLLLMGGHALLLRPFQPAALLLSAAGAALVATRLWTARGGWSTAGAGVVMLTMGLLWLPAGAARGEAGSGWPWIAGAWGVLLGASTAWLAGIARQARWAKAARGSQAAQSMSNGAGERWE